MIRRHLATVPGISPARRIARSVLIPAILGGACIHPAIAADETLENFRVEGNVATLLTKRRAIGFSADTGKWADIQRFQPDR